MQTTLLGLAIAIILALVTALVAPFVVNWNSYRSVFEEQASRVTGLDVRVAGNIDARILPTPRIKLHNVEIGPAGRPPQLRAGEIELEVGLGPLLRGVVRATEVRLVAPEISLGLDRSGAIVWPHFSPSSRPDEFTISRLSIDNGRVVLSDAGSGARFVLQKLWFSGDIGAFAGPFHGEGAFVAGDELYGYRVAGNPIDGGGLRLRLGVDPTDYPLTSDIDGTLKFAQGVPQFQGTLALARPAGAALAHDQRVMSDPWHLSGDIAAAPAGATLANLAFQYGPDERAINVSAKAELTFGAHPHLAGTVTAREIDVDRALANPDTTRRPPLILIRNFVEAFVATARLPMPAAIDLSVDAVTVGGTTIQSVQGGLRFDQGWSLAGLKFRAPGLTEVTLSGRLDKAAQGLAFTGPADLKSGDLKSLVAWLEDREAQPSAAVESLTAHGEVTASSNRLAIDRLTARLDQEKVEGRLAYSFAVKDHPASIDGALRAGDLDVDALMAFAKAATSDGSFAVPHEVALALDIGKATFAGIDVRSINAHVKLNSGVLRIDRLSIGDLGGAALDASGQIDELSSRPRGRLTLDLDANALTGLLSVVGKLAPQAADSLRFADRFIDRLAPAKVHGVLTVDRDASAGTLARLDLGGQVGALRLALSGEAKGQPGRFGKAAVHIDSKVDGDDGSALVRLLGLDGVLAVDQLPGQMTISAVGPLDGDIHVSALAAAGGFSLTAKGALRLGGEQAPSGSLQWRASAADLGPLQRTLTGQPGTAALPISANGMLAIAGSHLSLSDLAVTAGKASLRGNFALDLASPTGIDGSVEGDNVDAAAVAALLLGLPRAAANADAASWSAAPIGAGAFSVGRGTVAFKLHHAALTPGLAAGDLSGVVRLAPFAISLDHLDGTLAGGRLSGGLSFRHDAEAFAARGHVELAGADAAALLPAGNQALDGLLTVKMQGDSLGLSPKVLIGSLHGSGAILLADGHFIGLDTAAFAAAKRAADQSETIEAAKILAAVNAALASGRLAVPQGEADLTITAGQLRLAETTLKADQGAQLALSGILDLNNLSIDTRLTLSAQPAANALIATRPELAVEIQGPLFAPKRTPDISALMGWLTLRSAERQTRRLESIEINRRADVIGPLAHPPSPPPRFISPGSTVESTLPRATAAGPTLGARGLDRLRPEALNPAPPADIHPDATEAGHDAATGASPAASGAKPAPSPGRVEHVENAGATAGTAQQPYRRHPPPHPAPPARRSPWDFLFRSQH